MRFSDRVVVVTGAAQGIGRGVAVRAAEEGATLVIADRSELVREVEQEITDQGGDARSFIGDLEVLDTAVRLMDFAIESFGRIDVLINAVGGTIWRKPFSEYEGDQIESEIRRSLMPTLWCCRAVVPLMVSRCSGVIVNVSSNAVRSINRVPYAAAKGGVDALTVSLAFELGQYGIRVLATAPGGTEAPPRRIPRNPAPLSDDERRWHQETVDQTTESTFLKRYSTMDEQVGPILFAASDEAGYITGTVLPVSGGDSR
jgi:dihydroxycyclohexadiene carboxylate dehydrogenase